MDEGSPIIYGLEFQARALASQLAESNDVRFFIATQSLKPNNQLHLIDLNEETSAIESKIFSHPYGEVWKLNCSPHDARIIASCCSSQKGSQVVMQSVLLKLPESFDCNDKTQEFLSFESAEFLKVDSYGSDIKTTEFHPSDSNSVAVVVDGKVILFDVGQAASRVVAEINTKNIPRFSGGKWSQHHQGNQFIALHDCSIRSYDIRDANHCSWVIEDAHTQLVRDLDCNPNKQCHIATGGDDGSLKIWDSRNIKEPVFSRTDHSHWIWSVRFNTFHDQLILTSSSDCKILLTCAGSVSSEAQTEEIENINKERLEDGLLQTFDQHEDSVYCVEWSNAAPWIFASLSYDGRVIVSKVPKQYKYQILL